MPFQQTKETILNILIKKNGKSFWPQFSYVFWKTLTSLIKLSAHKFNIMFFFMFSKCLSIEHFIITFKQIHFFEHNHVVFNKFYMKALENNLILTHILCLKKQPKILKNLRLWNIKLWFCCCCIMTNIDFQPRSWLTDITF